MEKYSKEEIENFRKKDKRISLQGLVQVILATGANVHEVKENCDLAKQYSDCIEELVESGFEKPKEKNNGLELLKAEGTIGKIFERHNAIPMPTLAQQKTLEYIAVELKTELNDKLKNEVLDFVEQTYQKRIYPSKIPTADKFVAWYQNKW